MTPRKRHSAWYRLIRQPLPCASLVVLVLLHAAIVVGPRVWTISPQATDPHQRAAAMPPGPGHPLGTDELGRDELAGCCRAAR